jgi:hypothetical protein
LRDAILFLIFSYHFAFFACGFGRTFTIPLPLTVFLESICISGHRQFCILTVIGMQTLARRILFCPLLSYIHHDFIPLPTLVSYFCFIMLGFFFSARAFSLSAFAIRNPPNWLKIYCVSGFVSERPNARCCLFQNVITLCRHLMLHFFKFSYCILA